MATHLTDIPFYPEQSTQPRLDRQTPIDAYQNPGDGGLDRVPDLPMHSATQFLRYPLKVPLERGGSWITADGCSPSNLASSAWIVARRCSVAPSACSSKEKSPLAMARG